MSKKIFKKGRIVDLLIHLPVFNDPVFSIPDDKIPEILPKLIHSKRVCVAGLVRNENIKIWSLTLSNLKELGILAIPVVQVGVEFLNCKKFTFSCFFPPSEPEQVTTEFIRRFESITKISQISKMQALVDLVELTSGFILPTKVDLTPARMQCIEVLHKDWGLTTFDILHEESIIEIQNMLRSERVRFVACSDANMLSQIANRSISIKEGPMTFSSIRGLITGKPSKIKYSINLQPAGVFREKFHSNL